MKKQEFSLKKQKRFCVLFVASVVILILIRQSIVHYFLFLQKDDATVINLAGRQRMLSQRITKNYLLLKKLERNEIDLNDDKSNPDLNNQKASLLQNNQVLEDDLITFQDVHKQLQGEDLNSFKIFHNAPQMGNDSIDIKGSRSVEVKRLFSKLDPYFDKIVEIVERKLSNQEIKDNDYLNLIENESKFLPIMDRIVFQMNKEADSRVDNLVIESIILIVTLLVIALEWYYLFIPTLTSTEKYYGENLLAQKQLAEENRTKLSIIRNFNHEFNSPLNIVNGYLELLESLQEYDNEAVKDMQKASDELVSKINKITTFAKFQLNKSLNKTI